MKIIFSPAKELSLDRLAKQEDEFHPVTYKIMSYLKSLSSGDLQKLLKINDSQLDQQIQYIKGFDQDKTYPAISMYHGLAYRQLNISDLTKDQEKFMEDHIRILSAMYGPIRPMTAIKPYRLDFNMGLKLKDQSLKQIWKEYYQESFSPGEVILNLASDEFASLLNPKNFQLIQVSFYQQGKQHATYSKKGRGLLLNHLIQKGQVDEATLRGFNDSGFKYNVDKSSPSHLLFEK